MSPTYVPSVPHFPAFLSTKDFGAGIAGGACADRKPANRVPLKTVWDVMGLVREGRGGRGRFKVGQTSLARRTNVLLLRVVLIGLPDR